MPLAVIMLKILKYMMHKQSCLTSILSVVAWCYFSLLGKLFVNQMTHITGAPQVHSIIVPN